jgi:hypothetical protein
VAVRGVESGCAFAGGGVPDGDAGVHGVAAADDPAAVGAEDDGAGAAGGGWAGEGEVGVASVFDEQGVVRRGWVEDEHSLVVAGDDGALAVGVPADGVRGEVLGERDGDAGGEEGGWVGETGGWEVEETEA